MERISSQSKDNKIKSLEGLVVRIGYDPSDVKEAKEVINKKELDIATLKKHLKMPTTHDPLTKEIEETKSQRVDMMKLIIEQSLQIKQMEENMEKMIQEKDKATQMANTTMETLPISTLPC